MSNASKEALARAKRAAAVAEAKAKAAARAASNPVLAGQLAQGARLQSASPANTVFGVPIAAIIAVLAVVAVVVWVRKG